MNSNLSINSVQCMCGRRFLRVPQAEFAKPGFEGVECDVYCRRRLAENGVISDGATAGRPPKATS